MATDLRRVRLAGDLELEYAERGAARSGEDGPAIVFLHGYSDSWRSFERVLERLPRGVRGLALTQRGHGESDRPQTGYRIEDLAGDMVAFMDAIGLRTAAVVGHSLGSQVAQELAISRPDRVSHLVLAGSATTFDNPVVRDLDKAVRALRDPVPRQFASEFQESTVHGPVPKAFMGRAVDESLKMPARVWQALMPGILAYAAGPRLGALTMPTMVVWGDRDQICSRTEQDRLHERVPGARLAIYENTGHAVHWEQPERFVEDVMAFVGAQRPATSP